MVCKNILHFFFSTLCRSKADPKNVMLVHGEAAKMEFLKQKVMQEFGINCFMPANGEMVNIQTPPIIPADISRLLLKRTLQQCYGVFVRACVVPLQLSV